jgi:hypothetical protein
VLITLYLVLRGYRIFNPISIPVGNPYNLALAFLFVWFVGTIFFVTLDILAEYKVYYDEYAEPAEKESKKGEEGKKTSKN